MYNFNRGVAKTTNFEVTTTEYYWKLQGKGGEGIHYFVSPRPHTSLEYFHKQISKKIYIETRFYKKIRN